MQIKSITSELDDRVIFWEEYQLLTYLRSKKYFLDYHIEETVGLLGMKPSHCLFTCQIILVKLTDSSCKLFYIKILQGT